MTFISASVHNNTSGGQNVNSVCKNTFSKIKTNIKNIITMSLMCIGDK